MLKYSIKRLLQSIFTLFIVTTVVFLLLRLMPEEGYFSEGYDKMDESQIEAALTAMGLRDPIGVQLGKFFQGLAHGDLGKSIIFKPKVPITKIIGPKVALSLKFGLASVVLSFVLGIPLGMMMARFKGKFLDSLGSGYVILVSAVPAAVYFLFIQVYVTAFLKIPMTYVADKPITWILPALCMSMAGIASNAMWIRRYMVDELNKDYIRLARAKGMTNRAIMTKHVLRNAFVPMAQYLPASIIATISGSIYVESLFSIPGMGGLLVTVIQRQDNTVVQALVLIFATMGILGLFLGDVLMAICDPRIKFTKQRGVR